MWRFFVGFLLGGGGATWQGGPAETETDWRFSLSLWLMCTSIHYSRLAARSTTMATGWSLGLCSCSAAVPFPLAGRSLLSISRLGPGLGGMLSRTRLSLSPIDHSRCLDGPCVLLHVRIRLDPLVPSLPSESFKDVQSSSRYVSIKNSARM